MPPSSGSAGRERWVLLLHGLGMDHRMWSLQIPTLSKLNRILAPDLPGFGAQPPLAEESADLDIYADWVAQLLESRCTGPIQVVGYSLGGTIGLLLALRHPGLVSSLALCCASPCWGRSGRRFAAEFFLAAGRSLFMAAFGWSILRHYSRHGRDPVHRFQVRDMTQKADPATTTSLYRALARADLRPALAELRVPTLVVGGSRDLLAPPRHLLALAERISNAELSIVGGAGHALCVSHADYLSALLADFLNRRAAAEPKTEPWSAGRTSFA